MLRSIRLKNFRSLRDTGELQLRRIVVLVGANNSGKSSFLRFFPLLRQTAEQKSSSPLLWFHEKGYVDFGDFRTTLARAAPEPEIEIGGEVVLPGWTSNEVEETLRFTGRIRGSNGHSNLTKFTMEMWGDSLTLSESGAGEVRGPDGQPVFTEPLEISFKRFIPAVDPEEPYARGTDPLLERLTTWIPDATPWSRTSIASALDHGNAAHVLRSLQEIKGIAGWWPAVASFTEESPEIREIQRLTFARALGSRLEELDADWQALARGVRYIGPFREDPARSYRKVEIAVDEIAADGGNLAMFVHSLTSTEAQEFSGWVRQYFGFGVAARVEGQHVTLTVDLDGEDGPAYNLADMGFGISQVLPVIAQCWIASRSLDRADDDHTGDGPSLVALEQPELHLHPKHQYQLADMFAGLANATRDARLYIPLLLETHSEALIHRLGELIEEGRLAREDVGVLLFERPRGSETTIVRQTSFDAGGVLENWPLGFFR